MQKEKKRTLIDEIASKLYVTPLFTRRILRSVFIFLIFVVAWSVYGTLDVTVKGKGILLSRKEVQPLLKEVEEAASDVEGGSTLNGSDLIGLALFSLDNGPKINVGEIVEMDIPAVNNRIYGRMLGVVTSISSHPNSLEAGSSNPLQAMLLSVFGNASNVFQAVIVPLLSSSDPTDYRWTSGKQYPEKISSETTFKVRVITEKIRPIYYVFPLADWKYHNDGEP